MSYRTFKVVDKVTIRPDLSKHTNCTITGCYILACMWNHQGKTTTVAQVILEGNNTYYKLKIDNNYWLWTSFMFQQPIFKRKELQ